MPRHRTRLESESEPSRLAINTPIPEPHPNAMNLTQSKTTVAPNTQLLKIFNDCNNLSLFRSNEMVLEKPAHSSSSPKNFIPV
ncbi:hypothetical protein OnM2_021051 [Erysiphe neolycopersici]|uniref:Uncharacterized protein n=1 Tax=Erysiphe neolycopersici TaxID=212602 RepID=A0A420I346_9PEZI|nr:hypothetical protein OnM2_021051 [Erysiphe neolycopersici]